MLQWLYTYIANVCSQCFICVFGRIVASVIWMLHMFTHMLQLFYLDIAYVFNCFQVFLGVFKVFQKYVSSVSSVFFYMLQLLHLNVLKIDRTSAADLHLVSVDQISGSVSRLHGC